MQMISDSIVKPLHPNNHTTQIVPLTLFDMAMLDVHIPFLYYFASPTTVDNGTLIHGLREALVHFPHIAGSLTLNREGQHCISLDDTGVRVIETVVPAPLSEYLPMDEYTTHQWDLYPPLHGTPTGSCCLSQFQFNRFACGGLVIGLTTPHLVVDACSTSAFIRTWSNLVSASRGRRRSLDSLQFRELATMVSAINGDEPLDIVTPPFKQGPGIGLVNLRISYSKDFVAKLKSMANKRSQDHQHQLSRYQCLLAHVWRKFALARGLEGDVVTRVHFAMNGRKRVDPPMPNYLGNFVLITSVGMKTRDLLGGSYVEIAREIRKAILNVGNAYIKRIVGLGLSKEGVDATLGELEVGGTIGCHDMFNTSVLGFGFEEANFGGNSLCSILSGFLPIDGMTAFLPSCDGEGGGVDLFLVLKKEAADSFRLVSHSIE